MALIVEEIDARPTEERTLSCLEMSKPNAESAPANRAEKTDAREKTIFGFEREA